jgi:hypothetical protein
MREYCGEHIRLRVAVCADPPVLGAVGKRSAAKPPPKKKRATLATTFNCNDTRVCTPHTHTRRRRRRRQRETSFRCGSHPLLHAHARSVLQSQRRHRGQNVSLHLKARRTLSADGLPFRSDRAACVGKIKCRSCTAAFECRCESAFVPRAATRVLSDGLARRFARADRRLLRVDRPVPHTRVDQSQPSRKLAALRTLNRPDALFSQVRRRVGAGRWLAQRRRG